MTELNIAIMCTAYKFSRINYQQCVYLRAGEELGNEPNQRTTLFAECSLATIIVNERPIGENGITFRECECEKKII